MYRYLPMSDGMCVYVGLYVFLIIVTPFNLELSCLINYSPCDCLIFFKFLKYCIITELFSFYIFPSDVPVNNQSNYRNTNGCRKLHVILYARNIQIKVQNCPEIFLTKSRQIVCYACLSAPSEDYYYSFAIEI